MNKQVRNKRDKMKKEKCCVCKQYFPKNKLLFDYSSGNHLCLNCYKNQFAAK